MVARRLVARFATFWIGSSSSSCIAKGSSSSLDSLARFLGSFAECSNRVGRLFSESASLVAGVDLDDCSVVLNGTESIVLEGEERVFLRRGGIAKGRHEGRMRFKPEKREAKHETNKGGQQRWSALEQEGV